jgi:uncharacterized coiled-coil protein SlyX
MAVNRNQSPDMDLDRTDKLPILEGVRFDPDVEDDAVILDYSAAPAPPPSSGDTGAFIRPSPVDLPLLAESVRTIEARIERQNAEYESLSRAYERARDAESAAGARADALEQDLAAARGALEAEQARSRDIEKALSERIASVDATTVQVLHSLAERDAQLADLRQRDKALPALESRANSAAQLDADLASTRAQVAAISVELKTSQAIIAAQDAQLKRSEAEISAARSEFAAAQRQAGAYLELLRTREWRTGFDLNLFREMDARVGAADSGREVFKAECDQLRSRLADLEAKIAAQNLALDELQGAAAAQTSAFAQQAQDLKQAEQARTEWVAQLGLIETQRRHLTAELAARDDALAQARAAAAADTQRIAQLESEAANRDEQMDVLMAHLHEARRPIQAIEGDLRQLREELAAKTNAVKELTEEGDKLRAALERTRGTLEEREFLIRRLERSESNNATALGRIQTTMERLGSAVAAPPVSSLEPEHCPELVRIDGDRSISHALGRRTRIGRALGCELHIDSSSVSRHHALILTAGRETIIEDLNSTNGVIVNGRHVTRQVLNDGDLLTIGEVQFRYVEKPARRAAEPQAAHEQNELSNTQPPGAEGPRRGDF